jgi:UDP-N-acetylglucosamine--N-acetylmuramyl-(pentapeptide) pyrophosphoryl-undecaprenol N-acetylglucosamine transferase
VPLVLHEQNSMPGLANRLLSRWASAIAVTYERSAADLHNAGAATLTGNPVRPAVLDASADAGRARFGLAEDDIMLLVFGGSRGARHINQALVGLSERLMAVPSVRIVHIAGSAEAASVRTALATSGLVDDPRWQVLEYVDDMGSALAAADLVVARAGATSLAEITALGRPAILVPYPYATDDHQTLNAEALVAEKAALCVSDAELDTPRFGDALVELVGDARARDSMAAAAKRLAHPDAARRVAEVAIQAAEQADSPSSGA